ncbi:hypothetical protein BDY17DRAFT_325226 [Neohortaea acidophila]|uniref:DUF7918 domain-containing protein n=1 Tax=Neohortaea acidophila TaxID=245834 RepID=A0A6A6PNQ7_9PEZI|nr:uncharacterized protein BDY17DRAFT_325226 [Neohortaea acidophila]KAF2481709.1 hypothetical protein BDY17DRAFT_325226 [Neohortaea acidophila]
MKHPWRPNVSVTLHVDGQDLKEYENEEESAEEVDGCTEVVRYVESVVDANFSVEMQVAASRVRCDYELTVYLDGKWVAGSLYQDSKTENPGKMGNNATRNLPLPRSTPVTDGSANASLIRQLANVGKVQAVLRRCLQSGPQSATAHRNFEPALGSNVPEKALKGRAVSSRITLNNHVPCAAPLYVNVTYPWGEVPVGVYTFKYRSRRDLQIEGLIPRDIPLMERDPNTLTLAEARERIRLQEAQLQEAVKIKKEKRAHSVMIADGDDENDDNETMTAAERRAGKRSRHGHGSGVEVVDLTED